LRMDTDTVLEDVETHSGGNARVRVVIETVVLRKRTAGKREERERGREGERERGREGEREGERREKGREREEEE